MRIGECTVVVQSTDKNFMVPVGGSFIFAQNNDILDKSIYLFMQSLVNTQEGQARVQLLTSLLRCYLWGNHR